jgi:2-amino-4-hydroxy-6-hydroxymethyldihydropteridine diphosphokinase
MACVYVGIGSNIEPERKIPAAMELLSQAVVITGVSTFYRTSPIGRPEQPLFYNGVVRVETERTAIDLKIAILGSIENELGRRRTADAFAPRTIDLDILLYDRAVIHDNDVDIPDPDILTRPFLAIPLCELDPRLILPQWDLPITEVAAKFANEKMEALREMTDILRGFMVHHRGTESTELFSPNSK